MSKKKETCSEEIIENKQPDGVTEQAATSAELDELRNTLLRTAAEFDNFKKRTAKEKEALYLFAAANSIAEILPVFDSFERALEAPCSDEEYKKGTELIFVQLKDALTRLGIKEIEAQGQKFDPEYHNAVMHTTEEGVEEGTIVEVLQKGYSIGDKVIRHSMVKVAN